jgi:predicted small lipoprotein YifL
MNRRHLLALGALAAVVALAGCGFGPSEIPEDELTENATYDWDVDAKATFDLSRSSYSTVVNITNSSQLEVWQRGAIEGDMPVSLRSLQFRYRNGTVVNATHANLTATRQQERTVIDLPDDEGLVGYTASRGNKQFGTPAFVEGSYEFVLPPGTRIGLPLLSDASPGGWETTVEDNRQTVRWDEVTRGAVSVRFYLQRDILIFGSLFAIVVVGGVIGSIYYIRQIRQLEDQREELGLDVETEDDDIGNDGPPPGMR